MLSPGEFSVGCIGDATTSLTLVLPHGRYENRILVTQASGSPYAIFLDGQHQFTGFECTNNSAWNGILIPNVIIEISEQFIFDAQQYYAPVGALVRSGAQLDMVTRPNSGLPRPIKTPLIVGLPSCRQNTAAGFTSWRIVLGEGTMKRELMSIETDEKPSN